MQDIEYRYVLGVKFLVGAYPEAKVLLDQGALMVVPAAPALATIKDDKLYYEALLNSDFAIADSGFMVILLKILKGVRLRKFSGLEFLRSFLADESVKPGCKLFVVDPSEQESMTNHKYLLANGFNVNEGDHYIAPFYGPKVEDKALLDILEERKPNYILLNLGGGVQEKLGYYLKSNLSYRPGIICTGAAIAFLTGNQAKIPPIIDRMYLGWLFRILYEPKKFLPRYLKGFALFLLILTEK